jgi:hypothetical protein
MARIQILGTLATPFLGPALPHSSICIYSEKSPLLNIKPVSFRNSLEQMQSLQATKALQHPLETVLLPSYRDGIAQNEVPIATVPSMMAKLHQTDR